MIKNPDKKNSPLKINIYQGSIIAYSEFIYFVSFIVLKEMKGFIFYWTYLFSYPFSQEGVQFS